MPLLKRLWFPALCGMLCSYEVQSGNSSSQSICDSFRSSPGSAGANLNPRPLP